MDTISLIAKNMRIFQKSTLFFFFLFRYSCLHFSPTTPPTPATPTSHPWSYPPLALSMCPSYMFLDNPSPFSSHYSLPPPLWLLSVWDIEIPKSTFQSILFCTFVWQFSPCSLYSKYFFHYEKCILNEKLENIQKRTWKVTCNTTQT